VKDVLYSLDVVAADALDRAARAEIIELCEAAYEAIRRAAGIEPTPPDEQVMILRLPRTPPALVTTALLTAEWREGELW
jgi:hypothetical protein